MMTSLVKRLFLLSGAVYLLVSAVPAYSHNMPLGGSKWCAGRDSIVANIDLNETLLSELKGIKDRQYDYASGTDSQLQLIAHDFIQPYIDKKISLSVNGKSRPLKVDRLVRNDNSTFTIWLSVAKAGFNRPKNNLKIDYQMLLEENNAHLNLAYFYQSDATGEALQKVFDYSPAQSEYRFGSGSAPWELTVKGSAGASAASVAVSVLPAVANPRFATAREQGAAQKTATLSSGKPPVTREKGDARPDVAAVQKTATLIPAASPGNQGTASQAASVASPAAPPSASPAARQAALPVAPPDASATGARGGGAPALWGTVGSFLLLGIEHILTGYDHIAFLVGLIVIGLSTREVLKIITAFTVAHSITLLLAALQIIRLDSRLVESVIALSICYIALENLFKKKVQYRWLITFCFGLVHGFGFASALQELIVGKANLVLSVVSFNLGVETGQLMIFFILLPVLHLLKQRMEFRRVTQGVSLAIFLLGFTWLIERLFDLKLISS
jgi:hydrogenase/urease accessory protein HupE